MKKSFPCALFALALGTVAVAQEAPLQIQEFRGVAFVAGGVGGEENAFLDRIARDFTLEVVFALSTGEYLSDAKLRIRDAQGRTVLETVVDGPRLLVRLEPGSYGVWAEAHGQPQQKAVTIAEGGHARLDFLWQTAPGS